MTKIQDELDDESVCGRAEEWFSAEKSIDGFDRLTPALANVRGAAAACESSMPGVTCFNTPNCPTPNTGCPPH
ncbi:hypothetical protein D3C80_1817430 [compost metagenome]